MEQLALMGRDAMVANGGEEYEVIYSSGLKKIELLRLSFCVWIFIANHL